jgi:zinc protease
MNHVFSCSAVLRIFILIAVIQCSGTRELSKPVPAAQKAAEKTEAKPALAAHYRDLSYPPFAYTPPHPKDYRVELDSGVVAYLVRDTSLALVEMQFFFGSENNPAKPGEVVPLMLYSSLLLSGGTKTFTPEQIEDSLEFIAAGLSAHLKDHTSHLTLNSLKKDTYPMLDLLKQVVLEPRFDKDIFQLQKKRLLEGIQHRWDKPRNVLSLAYERVLFGSHPFNWMATEKDADNVRRKQLLPMAGRGYDLNNLVVAVAGDFDKKAMTDSLNRLISFFKKRPDKNDTVVAYRGPASTGVYLMDKDFQQASIKVGFPGLKRPHPDYYKLSVAS